MAAHHATIDDLIAQLRRRGQRATTARRAVLAELLDAGDLHLSAEELAERIHAQHPNVHLSTVYRTLDSLSDAGLVTVARFNDRPVTYHLTVDVHHHAVCTTCGAVINLPPAAVAALGEHLLRTYGFHAEPSHLTIPGRCARCAG